MTKLLYLDDMCALTGTAQLLEVIQEPEGLSMALVLDQTAFYPQGGGQPSDTGIISSGQTIFTVQGVSLQEGKVLHKGTLASGPIFKVHDVVDMHVDPVLRHVHNRNHTGGHIIDCALAKLGYALKSHKAYHFPQGPYVEYLGTLEQGEREQLQALLEQTSNELVQENAPVTIHLIDNDVKKRAMCIRGHEPILCGGTHVNAAGEVGRIVIRKIKNEKGNLRVSYAVE